MVLHRFLHDIDLLGREPLLQTGISSENLAAGDVVDGTRTAHAKVVIGGNGIHHINICTRATRQLQRVGDDTLHMAQAMGAAKGHITRQDARFDKRHQVEIYFHRI